MLQKATALHSKKYYQIRKDLIQRIIDGQASEEEQKMYDEIIYNTPNQHEKNYSH